MKLSLWLSLLLSATTISCNTIQYNEYSNNQQHMYTMNTYNNHDMYIHSNIHMYSAVTYYNDTSAMYNVSGTYGSNPLVYTVRDKLLLIGGGPQDITLSSNSALSYAESRM